MTQRASTTAAVPPELTAAREKLAQLPADWRSDALVAAVERRAALLAADRLLRERAARANAEADQAAAALAAGDLTGVDRLVDAQLASVAVERSVAALPPTDLDGEAVRAAYAVASAALDASDHSLGLPVLDYQRDVGMWRAATRGSMEPLDPPVPTDADRAAAARLAELVGRVDAAHAGSRAWRSDANRGVVEPLGHLAAAVDHIAAADALAAEVAQVREQVEKANRARAEAGLRWITPAERAGFRVRA